MAYELIDEPASAGRYELEPEAPAEKPGSTRRRLATAVGVPLIGPTLAALGVDVDPAGFAKGLPSGAADIGNTILNAMTKVNEKAAEYLPDSIVEDRWKKKGGLSGLVTGQPAQSDAGRANAEREASLKQFNAENDSPSFTAGRLTANIAGTSGTGGLIANTLRGVPRLAPLAESVASSGFRTGMAPATLTGKALDLGTRAVGGGITGAASAGLVNPSDAGSGALIGAMLPPGLQFLNKAGDLAGMGYRALRTPAIARDARTIVDAGGYQAADLPMVRQALSQQGPQIVLAPRTAPQILQNPGISQLARTLDNSGDTALFRAKQAQDEARQAVLGRISPVTGTPADAAENFGTVFRPGIRAADETARQRTQAAFDAVDPFGETAFILPIEQMQQAQQRFLGRGTFNGGANAGRAIDTARNIGEETLEAVAPARAAATQDEQTLAQAVRRAGGINMSTPAGQTFAGELRDLRQTPGLRGIIGNGRGQPIDTLAQRMHRDGFIPDDDPATLLNHLRDPDMSAGRGAGADMDRLHQAAREALQGDAPGATTIARPVPFREVQNLRSSIGEAHAEAQAKGRTREAAALDQMRRDIDAAVDNVAAGNGQAGENFPADIVNQWREALALHQDRMQRFRNGPVSDVFRDNVPDGNLAGRFFSERAGQAGDIAAFNQVATPETTGLLKNFAITQASGKGSKGALTDDKYSKWLNSRSGAVRGLFNESEQAQLKGVADSLREADNAAKLFSAQGSPTAKNAQDILKRGLMANPAASYLAGKVPGGSALLSALQSVGMKGRVDRLGRLMADPTELEKAIAAYQQLSQNRPLGLAGTSALSPVLARAPVALVGLGSGPQ